MHHPTQKSPDKLGNLERFPKRVVIKRVNNDYFRMAFLGSEDEETVAFILDRASFTKLTASMANVLNPAPRTLQ